MRGEEGKVAYGERRSHFVCVARNMNAQVQRLPTDRFSTISLVFPPQFLPAETKVMCGHRMRFGTKWSDKGLRFDFKQLISHLSLAQERAAMGNSKNPAKFDNFEAGAW